MIIIFLVEDGDSIRELVIYMPQNTRIPTIGFAYTKDLWDAMRSSTPFLMLLDTMLPNEDGLMILEKLRTSPMIERIPVIMLTAKGMECDKVTGLDNGAGDYIPKPFGMMELASRMEAALRRTEPGQKASLYQVGPIRVDAGKYAMTVDGNPAVLTFKEFGLLCYLMGNEGIVLTKDQLSSRIQSCDFDEEARAVDVHIQTLRQKLGFGGNYIETIHGVGYKMEEI